MDTISRENNSMLPLGGLVVGVVALIVSAIAVFSLPNVKKQLEGMMTKKLSHLDDIAAQATSADTRRRTRPIRPTLINTRVMFRALLPSWATPSPK